MTAPTTPPPDLGGSPAWEPFTVTVRRDESGDTADLEADLVQALQVRGLVGAVLDGAAAGLPGWVMLRVAIDTDGRVVTAGDRGPMRSVQVEELITALARHLGATVVVDDGVAVGPDGREIPTSEVEMSTEGGDARFVYAWRGHDITGARAIANGVRVPVTVYEHPSWVVAAGGHGVEVVVNDVRGMGLGYPLAVVARTAEVRSVDYVAGRGRRALTLDLSWVPPMRPVAGPDAESEAHQLAEWLATARLGGDLPVHPDLDEDVARRLRAAAEGPDGETFLTTVIELLGIPAVVAEIAEARPGKPISTHVRERLEPTSTPEMLGAALRAEFTNEPRGTGPFSRLRRFFYRRPGLHLAFGVLELVLALVGVVSMLGGWSDVPMWLRVAGTVLLAIDGTGNTVMAALMLRRRARATRADRTPG